jgi:ABC-2 type transport system ATP-binding protein
VAEPELEDELEAELEAVVEVEADDVATVEAEPEAEPEAEAEVDVEAGEEADDETVEADEEAAEPEPEPSTDVAIRASRLPKAVRRPARSSSQPVTASGSALSVRNLTKRFGGVTAVDSVDLEVPAGTFYGFVGPNGAGKTTTLSMVTGLLRPDSGVVRIHGADVWRNARVAKRSLGVLPDNLRLFDRLTGAEFLHHAGALRGLDRETTSRRIDDLVTAFGLRHSLGRFVSDYSAGMVKKIAIAAAMIHSPRLLVLDEPFESVDPVSAAAVIAILKKYAEAGGTVLLSSHSMGLIERTCDSVAIIADGRMLAAGPLAEVLDGESLETRFVELAGGAGAVEGMEWLQSYSD